jgi:NADH:quinone reductase (non-electrogenic)
MSVPRRQRIVVVGAGYGGVGTALRLARLAGGQTTIHLVDGRAEHQLITRLHEVAAGRLAPAAAAVPLRVLLAGTSVELRRAWVEGIDIERGRVITSDGVLEYDRLVLAPGSRTEYRVFLGLRK